MRRCGSDDFSTARDHLAGFDSLDVSGAAPQVDARTLAYVMSRADMSKCVWASA
jgi:hypothetical protein